VAALGIPRTGNRWTDARIRLMQRGNPNFRKGSPRYLVVVREGDGDCPPVEGAFYAEEGSTKLVPKGLDFVQGGR